MGRKGFPGKIGPEGVKVEKDSLTQHSHLLKTITTAKNLELLYIFF